MASKYSELLKDPRWQRKRLEIMERDNWTCQICSCTSSTLNVHHCDYLSGNEPWDYPEELLITLCEDCHKTESEERKEAEQDLIDSAKGKIWVNELYDIACGLKAMPKLDYPVIYDIAANVSWIIKHPEHNKEITNLLRKLSSRENENLYRKVS